MRQGNEDRQNEHGADLCKIHFCTQKKNLDIYTAFYIVYKYKTPTLFLLKEMKISAILLNVCLSSLRNYYEHEI